MKPKNNNFKFFIGHSNGHFFVYSEVFPSNMDNLKIKSIKDEGRIFFRRKLTGNPILINTDEISDYSLIKGFEQSTPVSTLFSYSFMIKRKVNNNYEEFWKGVFSLTNCKFDDDRCTVEIKEIQPDDKYKCVLENIEKKLNLFDIPTPYTCIADNTQFTVETDTTIESIMGCHGWWYGANGLNFEPENSVNNGSGGTDYTPKDAILSYPGRFATGWCVVGYKWKILDHPNKYFEITINWARRVSITEDINGQPNPPTLGNWTQEGATTISGIPAHKFFNTDYPSQVSAQAPIDGTDGYTDIWWGTSHFINIPIRTWTWNSDFDFITYSRNRRFIDMIEFAVKDCDLKLKSNFFTNPINTVTGIDSRTNNLLIAGKSDIKRPTTTEPQTLAYYTFKYLEIWMRDVFNVYWDIDDNNNLICEHIKDFNKIVGRNLKLVESGRYIKATNKYEYDSIDLQSRERWSFMDAGTTDFIGKDIAYVGVYATNDWEEKVQTHDIPMLTTDLAYVQYFPDSVSDEGFVLLATFVNNNGDLAVANEIGLISHQMLTNGHLCLANLHFNYHRYNRKLIKGYMNDIYIDFLSAIKIKKQVQISFPMCAGDQLDTDKLITTNMGNGEVSDAEFSLKTEMQQVILKY